MKNINRPSCVTVIAWITFVMSVLVLVATFLSSFTPGSTIGLFAVWGTLGGSIGIVSGIAMLKGLNWGRLLYLWVAPISIVLESLILGFKPTDIVRGALYLIILFFLTRSSSSEYFALGEEVRTNSIQLDEKRVMENINDFICTECDNLYSEGDESLGSNMFCPDCEGRLEVYLPKQEPSVPMPCVDCDVYETKEKETTLIWKTGHILKQKSVMTINTLVIFMCIATLGGMEYCRANIKIDMLSPGLILKDITYYAWPTKDRTPIIIKCRDLNGNYVSRSVEDMGMDRAKLNKIALGKYQYEMFFNKFNAAFEPFDRDALERTSKDLADMQMRLANEVKLSLFDLRNGTGVIPARVFLHFAGLYERLFAISTILLGISIGFLFLTITIRSFKHNT